MLHKSTVKTLIMMVLVISTLSLADEGYEEVKRLTESGAILPFEDLLPTIQALQPGRILELELEREEGDYIYEIEILDEQGAVWEFKVDAATGEILERELED
ncbi:MAG: PepSY domain-containing protein [Candidatus Thiodiazotropha sp. (ex. Lucinisca nassula)]|uniref:PepSY domain-containing protein n=1 Tax=Candidatus Thiodiazotropha sp. LNASS1 TaxID=3096260 RepID=UPI001D40BC52|nr:PepSY domain-containing protein [Candidatus Thiodiazotropha sp. (ex. Lucinisca nassula)]MBW9273708.1 PepSY domain-containing protein [Candidatus Thiodiazotropha sp. (ex. Lucinisca nassula)]